MKDISYEKIIERYCLEQKDILLITNGVLNNVSLSEIQSEMNGRLNKEKIYVIARSICKDLVGEDIISVAPLMAKEREALVKKSSTKSKAKNKQSDESETDSSQSAEDIINMIAELMYEV